MSNKRTEFPRSLTPLKRVKVKATQSGLPTFPPFSPWAKEAEAYPSSLGEGNSFEGRGGWVWTKMVLSVGKDVCYTTVIRTQLYEWECFPPEYERSARSKENQRLAD